MKIRKISIITAVLLCLIITGCSSYSDGADGFYEGEPVTPARMAEISKGLAVTKESTDKASDKTADLSNTESELSKDSETKNPEVKTEPQTSCSDAGNPKDQPIVYWTKNGEVWHTEKDCSSLSRSKEIFSGAEETAKEAGKTRACKRCG